jgi:hypothetical protein
MVFMAFNIYLCRFLKQASQAPASSIFFMQDQPSDKPGLNFDSFVMDTNTQVPPDDAPGVEEEF